MNTREAWKQKKASEGLSKLTKFVSAKEYEVIPSSDQYARTDATLIKKDHKPAIVEIKTSSLSYSQALAKFGSEGQIIEHEKFQSIIEKAKEADATPVYCVIFADDTIIFNNLTNATITKCPKFCPTSSADINKTFKEKDTYMIPFESFWRGTIC